MGVSVDRGMGVRFRTNNEDRSALVGKCYSGCLCWLFDRTPDHTNWLYKEFKFFRNVGRITVPVGYLLLKQEPQLLIR
jgi:hypothetical protein